LLGSALGERDLLAQGDQASALFLADHDAVLLHSSRLIAHLFRHRKCNYVSSFSWRWCKRKTLRLCATMLAP